MDGHLQLDPMYLMKHEAGEHAFDEEGDAASAGGLALGGGRRGVGSSCASHVLAHEGDFLVSGCKEWAVNWAFAPRLHQTDPSAYLTFLRQIRAAGAADEHDVARVHDGRRGRLHQRHGQQRALLRTEQQEAALVGGGGRAPAVSKRGRARLGPWLGPGLLCAGLSTQHVPIS